MARRLGIDVIAEGVETELQLSFLASNHCRCTQGFLFSKPLPIDALQEWLAARETVPGVLPAGDDPR
jgi:EAL domain-containing protein (putative c-di-GMP-specific phosphodiesterase class I)